MRHRHIRARRGEWVHVHRDKGGEGCLGAIVLLIIIGLFFKGC